MALMSPQSYDKPWYLTILLIVSVIQLLLTSSPIFGYSSILIIFKRKQFYKRLCPQNFTRALNQSVEVSSLITCPEQDKALNLLFVIGIIVHSSVKFLVGYIVDKIGAQICQYIGCVFILTFSFCLAYAQEGHEYLVIVAFIFLAFGCSFLMLTCFQVGNIMFKKNKSLFLCILSGSVNSSTAVFIIFLVSFEKGFSLMAISLAYGTFTVVFVFVTTSLLYPSLDETTSIIDADVKRLFKIETNNEKDFLKFSQELSASYHGGVTSSFNAYKKSIQKTLLEMSAEERFNDFSVSLSRSMGFNYSVSDFESSVASMTDLPWVKKGPYGVITENMKGYGLDESYSISINGSTIQENQPLIIKTPETFFKKTIDESLWSHIFSKLNILCVVCFTVIKIRIYYFIGNLDKYFDNITDKETGTTFVMYFGWSQFLGVLIGPLAGLLFHRKSKTYPLSEVELKIENIKSLIFPAVFMIANICLLTGLQLCEKLYLSIPIFLLYLSSNGLIWCFLTTFYGLLFPPQFFCSLFGFVMVVSGLVSFIQYPMLHMEQDVFHGDQFWTNLLFLILVILTFALPLYMSFLAKQLTINEETRKKSVEGRNVDAK